MNTENHDEIQTLLVPPPMDGPSEALVRRLRVLAHETPQRAPWWRSPLAAPLSFVGTAAAVVALTTLMPAKAGARGLDLIIQAADRINAFQFSIKTDEDGKRETFSIAGSDGRIYMRTGEGGLMRFDAGSMEVYDKAENKITRFKFGGIKGADEMVKQARSGFAEGMKGMDLKKMLREYREKYGRGDVAISPTRDEDGHRVYDVTLSSAQEPERVEMTVDAATDLPEQIMVQSNETHRTLMTMEMRFGNRVDARLLSAPFPANAKVEELDLSNMVGDAMKGVEDIGKAFEDKPGGPK